MTDHPTGTGSSPVSDAPVTPSPDSRPLPGSPAARTTAQASPREPITVLDMVWPETGLPVTVRVDRRPTDAISEDDVVELEVDFVTLSLSPLEFIQLAASLRMSVDALLDQHPGLQRAVIAAFDLRRDDR